ncbi:MAG: caspase family protein, partial [Planctomycetota bacterium]
GVLLEVFLDCCHAGTGLKSGDLGRPAELGPEHPTLARYLPPPIDIECRLEGEEDEVKAVRGFTSKKRSTVHHILWAGCKDSQTSADAYISGSYNGAFTYYFCLHVRKTAAKVSRKELLKRVRASLKHNNYWQTPQLECEATVRNAGALTTKGQK